MRTMICGIDEAGRGPVMGPLVVAGVKLKAEQDLAHLNVRDSKKCTPDQRIKLAGQIRELAEIELIILQAYELDIFRQVRTLNEIETILFVKIINKLRPEKVFVDCVDTNEENFKISLLEKLNYNPHIISKHKADDIFPIVSAASIIAKTYRDQEVNRISNELNTDIGSGYPADPVTIEFIKNWLTAHGKFPPYIRNSWKTTKRLWDDFKYPARTLDEY